MFIAVEIEHFVEDSAVKDTRLKISSFIGFHNEMEHVNLYISLLIFLIAHIMYIYVMVELTNQSYPPRPVL